MRNGKKVLLVKTCHRFRSLDMRMFIRMKYSNLEMIDSASIGRVLDTADFAVSVLP